MAQQGTSSTDIQAVLATMAQQGTSSTDTQAVLETVRRLELENAALQQRLASTTTMEEDTPTTKSPVLQGAPAMKPKPSLPNPPKFDGNRQKFRVWELEMKEKLHNDSEAIGTDRQKFALIFACLGSVPQTTVAAFYQAGEHYAYAPDKFMNYLASCYGDPNIERRALGRLENLCQKDSEGFASFLPRFEKELADSGGSVWPDQVRINYLDRALNEEMAGYLVSLPGLPNTYPEYVRALQDLASRMDSHRHRRTVKARRAPEGPATATDRGSRAAVTPSSPPKQGGAMDWEPTNAVQLTKAALKKDNDKLKGKRAKWVTGEEMKSRRAEGRCLRCGRTGCAVPKCPLKPARRPDGTSAGGTTKIAKAKPVLAAAVEESDPETSDGEVDSGGSSSESGNA